MSKENTPRWYSWGYWAPASGKPQTEFVSSAEVAPVRTATPEQIPSTSTPLNEPAADSLLETGWDRIKSLYEGQSMETDVVQRVARMSFFGGFIIGGASGYRQASATYELNNVGRKYLSPSDSVKRRTDYAILRFAKSGFGMGIKAAAIAGVIVLATTHLAAYRKHFSSWYFPALSGALAVTLHTASFGTVFAFPLGLLGSAKACGLGISSGLTLTAVVHLYALSVDKSVNDAYWLFKRDYEKELNAAAEWDRRVEELMKAEKITWRQTAVKRLKEQDEARLRCQDD